MSFYFNGKIADVRFWNTARIGDGIKANMNKVLTGNENGLVGYWKLNDDLGTPEPGQTEVAIAEGAEVDDAARHHNKGTIQGYVSQTKEMGEAANKGGLTGNNTGTVTGCFCDAGLYGLTPGTSAEARSTEGMKSQSTFDDAEWDLDLIWKMPVDGDYPCFRVRSAVTVTYGKTDTAIAVEGETVAITADEPPEGQQFKAKGPADAKPSARPFYLPHLVSGGARLQTIPPASIQAGVIPARPRASSLLRA